MTVGMNFGAYLLSGASQIHYHYQVAGLGSANSNMGDMLGELCRDYRLCDPKQDYLSDYEAALRRTKQVLEENECGILYVPVAQRMKHELQVMVRRPEIGNLRDTDKEIRGMLAALEYRAIQIYDHR